MSYALTNLLLLLANASNFRVVFFFLKKWNVAEDEVLNFLSILPKKEKN